MATGRVQLPIPGGFPPSGVASAGNLPIISSTAAVTNGPKARHHRLTFDPTTDEHWMWAFPVPGDYASGGTFRLWYGSDATSGNVIWKAAHGPVIAASTDTDTAVLLAVTTSSALAVPATSGVIATTTIAPAATGIAANEWLEVMLGRDADNGSDTVNANDCWIIGAQWEYVI